MAVRAERPLVVVDAENVRRSGWPNLSPRGLIQAAQAYARERELALLVVFDGPAPGGATAETPVDDRVTMAGTTAESADDWIARRTAELALAGRRLWLVSSDRALRERVGGAAERVVGGGSFLRELRRGNR